MIGAKSATGVRTGGGGGGVAELTVFEVSRSREIVQPLDARSVLRYKACTGVPSGFPMLRVVQLEADE